MAAKIEGGCTLWARKTFDSDIFYLKPDKWFKIWFYIVGKVNHKDSKQFKRGDGFFKYEWIMSDCSATKSQVDHFMRWAKQAKQIVTRKATRGFYVTVLNYPIYQDMNVYYGDTESDTKSDLKATQKRHSSYKNGKNVNKEEPKNIVQTMQGQRSRPPKPHFDFGSQSWLNITESHMKVWKAAYPACDIQVELAKMKAWLLGNPERRKTRYDRFIPNWLARSQDKGGTRGITKIDEKDTWADRFTKKQEE